MADGGLVERPAANAPVPLRVLILEDRSDDAELMVHELRRSRFKPIWNRVDTEADYITQMLTGPDVILADYRMPRLNAPRALELLQELRLDIPFIVVSGAIGEDVAVEMMRKGATDYLLKDRLRRLGPAVKAALNERRLREEKRTAERAAMALEARFNSFMNNSPALAFIKDEDGRLLYINNTCEQVWNATLAECEGKLDYELWPSEAAIRFRNSDLAVLASGETSRVIEELPLRDGCVRHMLAFRFPFRDAQGRRMLGGVSVDITDKVRTERALASALTAKDVLLREVHHRVKNNLQVISSLLNMQAELLSDGAPREIFRESQQRVQSMAMIHERLYSQDDLDSLNFREYVEELTRDLFAAYCVDFSRVSLRLELDEISLELDRAIPCGLILNELLTNSLKYAFPKTSRGEILVALHSSVEGIILRVADNGVGLPADFDWKQPESLGLRIVQILARQLGGAFRYTAGNGADFSLAF